MIVFQWMKNNQWKKNHYLTSLKLFNTDNHDFLLKIRSKLFHLPQYCFWFGSSLAISHLLVIPRYSCILYLYISLWLISNIFELPNIHAYSCEILFFRPCSTRPYSQLLSCISTLCLINISEPWFILLLFQYCFSEWVHSSPRQ